MLTRKNLTMKTLTAVTLSFTLLLSGCSLSTIKAAPIPTTNVQGNLFSAAPCRFTGPPATVAEAFALGDIQADGSTVDEGDDFLEISQPVFAALCVVDTSYVTKFAHNVQSIGLQMGSGKDALQEWAFWVDVTLPSGKVYRIPKVQFDKHTDYRGNSNTTLEVHWTLPAGTTIRIRRPAVVCISDPSALDCLTGQSVTFVGK